MAIYSSLERFSEDCNGSMADYPASLLQGLTKCPASIRMTVRNGSEWVSGIHRNHRPESVRIRSSVKKERNETRPRYGTVNFERRKHPRFNVDLPIEYGQTGLFVKHGRAVNASEGGLLLYLQERMEIGKHLVLRLFFPSGPEMNTMKTLVQVFWMDVHMGKDWGDYRTGVKFVDISLEDLDTLEIFRDGTR